MFTGYTAAAEKVCLRAFTASRKTSRKFVQASHKPKKLRLRGMDTDTHEADF
jgi:hypothetical protein